MPVQQAMTSQVLVTKFVASRVPHRTGLDGLRTGPCTDRRVRKDRAPNRVFFDDLERGRCPSGQGPDLTAAWREDRALMENKELASRGLAPIAACERAGSRKKRQESNRAESDVNRRCSRPLPFERFRPCGVHCRPGSEEEEEFPLFDKN